MKWGGVGAFAMPLPRLAPQRLAALYSSPLLAWDRHEG